jgi:hypothetical protein
MTRVNPETQSKREAPARKALRMETRGLILLAAILVAVYLVRYFHLLHRSTP